MNAKRKTGHQHSLFAASSIAAMAIVAAQAASAQDGLEAAEGGYEIQEIIVTAEKIERSLDETATSASVLDSAALETRPAYDSVNDLLTRLANVTGVGTTNFVPTVRGIDGTGPAEGSAAFIGGTRPRLTYQVDGRPLSFNESVFGDMSVWDVAQVVMLRGPQSSLQGRNSIGGMLSIRTNDPTYEWEAGARLAAGSYDARTESLVLSGPLVADQLAFRIAADHQERNSWLPMAPFDRTVEGTYPPGLEGNYYYNPALVLEGASSDFVSPEEFETTTARLKLLLEPSGMPNFRTLATINHNEHRAPQGEWAFRVEDTAAFDIPPSFGSENGFIETYPAFNPPFDITVTNATIESSYDLANSFALESTISYADIDVTRSGPDVTDATVIIDSHELLIEPRAIFSAFDDRLSGIAGVYYFNNQQTDDSNFFNFFRGVFDDETTTVAAFTELTFSATPALDLTLGGRYEREERYRVGNLGSGLAVDFQETYNEFMPKVVLTWHAANDITMGVLANRGYNGGGAGFTFNQFVQYEYGPEYAWNYEGFFRGHFLDRRLSVVSNVFLTQYEDFQAPYDLNPGPLFDLITLNADGAESYGAEVSLSYDVSDGWVLYGDAGYTHAEITDFAPGKVFNGQVLPVSEFLGNTLARAPKYTAKVGTTYDFGRLDFGLDARYSDGYYSTIVNNPDERVSSFWVANAQVGITLGEVRLYATIRNLFDSDHPLYIEQTSWDFDFDGTNEVTDVPTYSVVAPRTFMLGIEFWM